MSWFTSSTAAQATGLIGGLFHREPRSVTAEALRRMAGCVTDVPAIACRGQERAGIFAVGRANLEQSDDVWVVADMDLLNREELYAVTDCKPGDDALLSRLYATDGPRFVKRLRGAFAIALWDRRQQQVLLAVDHFGMRRLYYTTDQHDRAFGSRVAAVVAAPGGSHPVDLATVHDYLNFKFVPAPATPFAGIRRLPPGCILHMRRDTLDVETFWDLRYPEERLRRGRAASSVYRFTRDAVAEAVKDLTAKQTGAFLSGGTDSSTVVGLMTRITGEPVNSFSIGFSEERYDELGYAGITARHFRTNHHTRIVTADAALAALPGLIEAYDEPLGNNSVLGTLFCAQLAREHGVTHLLAGDGGDEIFGGNERYRTDRIFGRYARVPAMIRRGLLEPILLGYAGDLRGVLGRAQRYIRRANLPNPARFYSYEFFMEQNGPELLQPEFLRAAAPGGAGRIPEEHSRRVDARSELNRLLYLDLKLAIGDNDLFKVNRTADMAGVSVRFPFLALPLVEFVGTLPAEFKVRGLEKRYLFKRAFRDLLARETLAKRKQGFGVPTAEWFKTHRGFRELARDTLLSARAAQRGYFKAGALEKLFAEHDRESSPYYGDMLWSVLMLELWHRSHADTRGARQ